MIADRMLRLAGVLAGAFGLLLLIETGRVALALGALFGAPLSTPEREISMTFWFQLAFIRLFAVAMLGLATFLIWSAARLTTDQQRSLARVAAAVFALLTVVALVQQVAIWSAPAGWAVAGVLAAVASVCWIGGTTYASPRASS